MNWDYCLDEPEDDLGEFDEDYVDGDEEDLYDEHIDIEELVGDSLWGDYRSDEYERIVNGNY